MAKDRVDRDDEDLVRLYLSDIGQYTLLTKDDEVRLAQTIEEGREAKAELDASETDKKIKLTPSKKLALKRSVHRVTRQNVTSYSRTCASSCRSPRSTRPPVAVLRPHSRGQPRSDARGREFDWRKGFKFSTYGHLVDSPGDHPWYRQYRSHDPTFRCTPGHVGPGAEGAVSTGTQVRAPRPSRNCATNARCPRTS